MGKVSSALRQDEIWSVAQVSAAVKTKRQLSSDVNLKLITLECDAAWRDEQRRLRHIALLCGASRRN